MTVTKRDGRKVEFDRSKIVKAITKAFVEVYPDELPADTYTFCAKIADDIEARKQDLTVEEIQDIVVRKLMASKYKDVATQYVQYRYQHELIRQSNTTDKTIKELLDGENEYWKTENSNKNPKVVTTQRDYIAGVTSTDITRRFLLPKDIVEAHDEGIIHFHDADYYAQLSLHNCELINLQDMLQNGTVINGVQIDKPHRLITAATIATQIITAVTSSSYGGATINLSHLAPFVRDSREWHRRKYLSRGMSDGEADRWAMEDTQKEIADAVQTFNYQVNSMTNTNGQAPFLSVFMYLNDDPEYQEETALLIEEFLRQRILGFKNESGHYITPAFPKLLYVLDENNITEESPYWYLTVLAAQCTAKRLVPDYISAKIMRRDKVDANGNGNVYGCMGCVAGDEVITYRMNGMVYTEAFSRAWNRLSRRFAPQIQPSRTIDKYIDLEGVEIYDAVAGWTKCLRMIRNEDSDMLRLRFSNGRMLDCTPDHPFETENRGVVQAADLTEEDVIRVDKDSVWAVDTTNGVDDYAWMLGLLLCDSSYVSTVCVSIAATGEDEIRDWFIQCAKKYWNAQVKDVLHERGAKGTYRDLIIQGDGDGKATNICSELEALFEGRVKSKRHIPNEVFNWGYSARLSFMAGMIDADGYINDNFRVPVVQIGSTNKELAIQQALLAQTLGMRASIYQNHYKGKGRGDTIRYQVSFHPTAELVDRIACKKKQDKFNENELYNPCISMTDFATLTSRTSLIGKMPSYDVTTSSEHFTVSGIYSHNCRSFLTPYLDAEGKPKYWGRFNQGVVTINLPDVALSSGGDMTKFWELLDERLELCHRALQCRHERLALATADVAPILWRYGALARLPKGAPIHPLLHNGYSTLSLGYAGLYECVKYMTGESHSHGKGFDFGIQVMEKLNEYTAKWKAAEHIDYSLYGSPIETTTYKFATCLKRRFGEVEGITDHGYITNSYHINVREPIDPFEKLAIEAKYQKLSPGGAISYIECSDLTGNTDAVLEVLKFIYDNIMYAELNTKSDYCQVCGYEHEIEIVDNDGVLSWRCPNCGNTDQSKMNVARRTCGYIGTQYWNQGRTEEIRDRYVHLDNHEVGE